MKDSYSADFLPITDSRINQNSFLDEIIDAQTGLGVYKEKIKDSKLNSSWFMPTLQQKEALTSSMLEGTQATLDGVLIDQITPNTKDKNLNEVRNYYDATVQGYTYLQNAPFSHEFFSQMHCALMNGNVRKPALIGQYRTEKNYIGRNDASHAITFIPPAPDQVFALMDNLIMYMNHPQDSYKPLIRTAIIHAQFETIHPFMDGNGRVGRMLIPMYLYAQKQIDLPCFFLSEALERDKIRYYSYLNDIRYKSDWNSWIKFFLSTVAKQCKKYVGIITDINALYEDHLNFACNLIRSPKIVDIMNVLYRHPIVTARQIEAETTISLSSIQRYLNVLTENHLLFSDNKSRNRTYYYYDLLEILR